MLYTTVGNEVAAARSCVGLADLSAFAKFSLLGPDAALVADALTAAARQVFTGHGVGLGAALVAAALTGAVGGSKPNRVDRIELTGSLPFLCCRLTQRHSLFLASTSAPRALEWPVAGFRVSPYVIPVDVTSAYAEFGLAGPNTTELLRHLTAFDVSEMNFPPGNCAETSLAGVYALLVREPSPPGNPIRVCVPWDLAEHVWETLLDAGRGRGIIPVGLQAWPWLAQAEGPKF